jgi:hypothetical protein
MRGFRDYLLNEIRHAMFRTPIQLNIAEPVNGHFQTATKSVNGIDMKYEFYLGQHSLAIQQEKFIQQFPEPVRTHEGQVLINEGFHGSMGGKFYATTVDVELLHKALTEKVAFVDIKKKQLVKEMGEPNIIECQVNFLNQYQVQPEELYDHEHGLSRIREGWEQLKVFHWWDFVMCSAAEGGYAKKSCCYDTQELTKIASLRHV